MKKLSIIVLAIVLCIGILPLNSLAAPANPSRKVATIDYEVMGDYIGRAGTNPEQTRPGDEIIIPLMWDGFRDADGSRIDWGDKLYYGPTTVQLKQSQVVPHMNFVKGSKNIRDVSIVSFTPTTRHQTYSAIRIRFVEELVSTQEFEYQFSLMLYVGGKANSVTLETFGGRMANETYHAYKKDYVFVGDGIQVRAHNPIVDLELDLGRGITAFVDTNSNELYYGTAKHYSNEEDKIAKEYPEVTEIYDIKSINIGASNTRVHIAGYTKDDALYVYNVLGKYVGMSNERLPFSNRYYLSTKEVTIDPSLIDLKAVEPSEAYPDNYQSPAAKSFIDGVEKSQTGVKEAPTEY